MQTLTETGQGERQMERLIENEVLLAKAFSAFLDLILPVQENERSETPCLRKC